MPGYVYSELSLTALATFPILIAAFWFVAEYFGITPRLSGHVLSSVVSFALILGPYWFFGFGLAGPLSRRLNRAALRISAPLLLLLPYIVFTVPRGQFRWDLLLGLAVVLTGVSLLLERAPSQPGAWQDWAVLLILALAVETHVFNAAFPVPGLSGLAKLIFVDLALYGYLVIRPIGGIGFDFFPRAADFTVGLREFLYFTPIAILLGFALRFLHLHRTPGNPAWFAAGWLFTLFFIAIPEELFFRGLLLNMLERRIGVRAALWSTSLVFGLAHFNKRAVFNWRYVILAAIAGLFYGRAWLARRRVLTSGITHATVDTVWSIWLR
ncbi:MAG: Abortive infection protein [Bryobacterales bacterium]|nr:Abortive infection protein [Bryobacterales bacterium]